MPRGLAELQPLVRRKRACTRRERSDLAKRRQKSLAQRVEARGARRIAVPEVDRKRAVRAVDVDRLADAQQLAQKTRAQLIAIRAGRDAVARNRSLIDADVLNHPRRDHDVEEIIRERKRQRARDHEPVAMLPLPPLPLAQLREIIPPRIEPALLQEIDGHPFPTPATP